MRKIYIIGAMALLVAACKPTVRINKNASPGRADFANYMAVGNSLTAGYADNSLYLSGQLNSYPERLFEQFQLVGCKGPFVQPLLTSDEGFPAAKYVLGTTTNPCTGISSLGPIADPNFVYNANDAVYSPDPNNPPNQINNLGVPGIRMVDYAVAGYADPASPFGYNYYAARFYNNVAGTPMDELIYRSAILHPTFFTFWLGSNDVLAFALAGGVGNGSGNPIPLAPGLYSPDDISPTMAGGAFQKLYDSALNVAISYGGVSGALINIPNIATIPFFTTVPANGLILTRQSQADSLNAAYNHSGNYSFNVGANYFVVQAHDGSTKQAVPGELILLSVPQDSITCAGWGSIKPIPNQYVITTEELQDINAAVTSFNTFIQFEANKYKLAYVDMYSYLGTVTSGLTFNGVNYNAQYVSGGAFSLDGVHLTQRGYAIVANKIITDVNGYYGASIPSIDVNKYPGVSFP